MYVSIGSHQKLNSSVIRQKGESQNGCFKKTKHAKFSAKMNIFNPLTRTRTFAYQGVKNVRFSLLRTNYDPYQPKLCYSHIETSQCICTVNHLNDFFVSVYCLTHTDMLPFTQYAGKSFIKLSTKIWFNISCKKCLKMPENQSGFKP